MKRVAVVLSLIAGLLVPGSPAAAARIHSTASHSLGSPVLKPRSNGPDDAAMQWLVSGHKPYALSKVKPTLKSYDKGISGDANSRTWRAVVAMKFRLGYPAQGQCSKVQPRVRWNSASAGPYFFALLLGHKQRPACWVALSAKRVAAAAHGATPLALKLKAFELGQVGVREPYAQRRYNSYFHLPTYLQWCAIFQGYSRVHVGLALLGAPNPWYVPSIIEWGRYHGLLRATAQVGEYVLYYGDISHIGYVIAVDVHTGAYWTVEGNWRDQVGHVAHSNPRDHLHYFYADPKLVH